MARPSGALWHGQGRCAAHTAIRPPITGGGLCACLVGVDSGDLQEDPRPGSRGGGGAGGDLIRLTCADTPIRLCEANHAKIAALDQLAAAYLQLCQAYTTYFCTEAQPDGYLAPCFASPLSQRWGR